MENRDSIPSNIQIDSALAVAVEFAFKINYYFQIKIY